MTSLFLLVPILHNPSYLDRVLISYNVVLKRC